MRAHGRGPIVHMKALLIFLNLGQVNPSHPALAPGVVSELANLASMIPWSGQGTIGLPAALFPVQVSSKRRAL